MGPPDLFTPFIPGCLFLPPQSLWPDEGTIGIGILTAVFYRQETEAQSGSQLVSEDGGC